MIYIPMLGFLVALISQKLCGGTLHDANGIPPLRLSSRGRLLELDAFFWRSRFLFTVELQHASFRGEYVREARDATAFPFAQHPE